MSLPHIYPILPEGLGSRSLSREPCLATSSRVEETPSGRRPVPYILSPPPYTREQLYRELYYQLYCRLQVRMNKMKAKIAQ